jgi:hypothetical protein
VIIPANVKELYIVSFKNRKSITIIKTIIIDGREPLPLFVIALKKKVIDNWINKKLIKKEKIVATLISYTNEIAMQYINHLIKYSHARPDKL